MTTPTPLRPTFDPSDPTPEIPSTRQLIQTLQLNPHPEGGYYAETDRSPQRVPNPFAHQNPSTHSDPSALLVSTRSACTSIHYLLTPASPLGHFHRNKGRTVHTLHRGRGRYVIIHADEVASTSCPGGYSRAVDLPESRRWTGEARVETFVVGQDVESGERLQWVVEGGKYKASFLLEDDGVAAEGKGGKASEGLLISETVVPGFEFEDHDFLGRERLGALVGEERAGELGWMVRRE
ncbi:hypothetical protein B0A50_04959 [Salinomyces thailandicus]|uniref:DUF985 domain-containing protein n=1 Tax=Salinomyces thailandicus TaxID=706561 RepID=A0A4U0TY19_9PEZI|nr:hypothetical protein B0A50_04959 [Salinomyces thailandica]